MSFISWILFILFGGIGLPAIPLDFIYYFTSRPKTMSRDEMDQKRKTMNIDIERLREVAAQLKELEEQKVHTFNSKFFILLISLKVFNSQRREYDELMRKFKANVYILDDECTILDMQGGTVAFTEEELKERNDDTKVKCDYVVCYWLSLFFGIILLLISLTWFIHMYS